MTGPARELLLSAFAVLLMFAGSITAQTQEKETARSEMPAVEREIRDLYDAYAEDLRSSRRESIVDRYDRRGVYMVGNGSKSLTSFDQIRDQYMNRWSPPRSFSWKDLSVEVISKNAVVVIAKFEWQTDSGKTLNYSYTGVLTKQNGKWRIRVEDESAAPPGSSGN